LPVVTGSDWDRGTSQRSVNLLKVVSVDLYCNALHDELERDDHAKSALLPNDDSFDSGECPGADSHALPGG
jgi:hypothetical protein